MLSVIVPVTAALILSGAVILSGGDAFAAIVALGVRTPSNVTILRARVTAIACFAT